jgi:hypothetical protein
VDDDEVKEALKMAGEFGWSVQDGNYDVAR